MAKLSALGKAKPKAQTTPASATPIFVAAEVKDADGNVIHTAADVKTAIEKVIESGQLADRAKAMMTANRPTALDFARRELSKLAAQMGRFPENSPKLATDDKGDGSFLTAAFLDKVKNLTDEQFADLVDVIGEENATAWTRRGHEFGINNEMLETELDLPEVDETDEDGAVIYANDRGEVRAIAEGEAVPAGYVKQTRKQTYFDLLDAAVTEKFVAQFGEERAGELLDGFFTRKPVFCTKKGLLDMLPGFCKGDGHAFRLAKALIAANVEVQLKPGVVKKDDKK